MGGCRGTGGCSGTRGCRGTRKHGGGAWGGPRDTEVEEDRGMQGHQGMRRDREVQGDWGTGGHRGMQGDQGTWGGRCRGMQGTRGCSRTGGCRGTGGHWGGHPGTGDHWCWWRRGTGAQGGRAVPPPGQHPPKFRLPAKPPARPGAGGAPSQRGRAVGLPPAPQIYSFYFPGFRTHQRHGAGLAPAAAALPISLIYGITPKREEEEEGGWGLR